MKRTELIKFVAGVKKYMPLIIEKMTEKACDATLEEMNKHGEKDEAAFMKRFTTKFELILEKLGKYEFKE